MASIRKRVWNKGTSREKTAWVVDYKDAHGKRHTQQFVRKKEAEAWRDNAGWEVRQGIHTPASQSITIEQAAKLWLAHRTSEQLEPTTLAAYDQHVRLHINPTCGSRKLNVLTRPIAETIRDELVAKLSRPMAVRVLRSLRAIVAEGVRVGAVALNVFADVSVKRARRGKSKVSVPLKGELKALIRVAPLVSEPMALPLVLLLVFAGLRASELRGLQWRSIDLKKGLLTVEQRADAKNVMGPPKSEAGHRTIPLPNRVVTALREWRLQCPKTTKNLVFPSVGGLTMSYNYMAKNIFAPVQIMAGMFEEEEGEGGITVKPRYGLHALRHAAASLWIERRVGPKTVQTWMGHSSIQVTFDLYGHLFEKAELDSGPAAVIEDELMGYLDAAWVQHAA